MKEIILFCEVMDRFKESKIIRKSYKKFLSDIRNLVAVLVMYTKLIEIITIFIFKNHKDD